MKKALIAAGVITGLWTGSAAGAMPVSVFLAKADALQKKGPMALFSGDIKVLKGEMGSASAALRAERAAAKATGRPQAYCPPEGSTSLNSNELLAAFRQIPPAQRARMEVKDGLRNLLARKYPCR